MTYVMGDFPFGDYDPNRLANIGIGRAVFERRDHPCAIQGWAPSVNGLITAHIAGTGNLCLGLDGNQATNGSTAPTKRGAGWSGAIHSVCLSLHASSAEELRAEC
jgi:hypothetical protein